MNPTRRTPTGPRRGGTLRAAGRRAADARLHPNPAGTASEHSAADQRGGAKPNPPAGTRNATQLPTPGRALRTTDPHRPARIDTLPAPARLRILNNPPQPKRPGRRNRAQKPQRREARLNATNRTQTATRLLALGRTIRAANPNRRTRLAAPAGLRILNNPPQPKRPRRHNRAQGPQRRAMNSTTINRTQAAARLLASGRTIRAAHPKPRTRLAAPAGLRILDHRPEAAGAEKRI